MSKGSSYFQNLDDSISLSTSYDGKIKESGDKFPSAVTFPSSISYLYESKRVNSSGVALTMDICTPMLFFKISQLHRFIFNTEYSQLPPISCSLDHIDHIEFLPSEDIKFWSNRSSSSLDWISCWFFMFSQFVRVCFKSLSPLLIVPFLWYPYSPHRGGSILWDVGREEGRRRWL